jgi:hypothetical protein
MNNEKLFNEYNQLLFHKSYGLIFAFISKLNKLQI